MASESFQALSSRRAARAGLLAERYPDSAEVLRFYGATVSFQNEIFPRISDEESLLTFREPLIELVREHGPEPLQQAAADLDAAALATGLRAYRDRSDTSSPSSFFARAILQPFAASRGFTPAQPSSHCPRCGHRPQVGVVRPQANGSALTLLCSLCPNEWSVKSGRCASCGEESEDKYAYYSSPDFAHLRVQACESCRTYHHTVDLGKDPAAVPDVDELTAIPLDVWAREQGYEKLQPNLVGI